MFLVFAFFLVNCDDKSEWAEILQIADLSEKVNLLEEFEKQFPQSDHYFDSLFLRINLLSRLKQYQETIEVSSFFLKTFPNHEKILEVFELYIQAMYELVVHSFDLSKIYTLYNMNKQLARNIKLSKKPEMKERMKLLKKIIKFHETLAKIYSFEKYYAVIWSAYFHVCAQILNEAAFLEEYEQEAAIRLVEFLLHQEDQLKKDGQLILDNIKKELDSKWIELLEKNGLTKAVN